MQENTGSAEVRDAPLVAPKPRPHWGRRWTGHGIRLTFWTVLTACLVFAAIVAATRFWLVPNADSFRPRVVQELSRVTGQRVVIGGFTAGWNGWSPEFKMSDLQILDGRGRTLLQLPEVDTTLSWRSLILLEPRLSALTIRAPRVIVRRTAENALTVAGIDVDLNNQSEGDSGLAEWLLKQRLVQISGGELEWQDDWRKLPPLRLKNVNIRLQNSGNSHKLGMTATPPHDLASPLDLRAEFSGSNLRKVSDWDGLAYLRTDYANLGTLTRYFPLPVQLARGEGGIQAWFEFEDGQPVAVTTDLVVRNARLQLATQDVAAKVEPLDVSALSGRLSWRDKRAVGSDPTKASGQQRWSIRDLKATTTAGFQAPAATGEVLVNYSAGVVTGGEVRVAELELASATSLAKALPIPPDLAARWVAFQPSGVLRGVDAKWRDNGEAAASNRYVVEGIAELKAVGWRAQNGAPGVSGLSGAVTGSNRQGELRLSVGATSSGAPVSATEGGAAMVSPTNMAKAPTGAKVSEKSPSTQAALIVDLGKYLSAPLTFDALTGVIVWKRALDNDNAITTHLDLNNIQFANADAAGQFNGTWDSDRLGPGVSSIVGTLARANTTSIHRYLPMSLSPGTHRWIKDGVLAGTATDAKFIVKGPLWHFPFHNDEQGVFEVDARVTGGALDYADHWPRADNINTRLLFRGSSLTGQVAGATIAGVPVGATEVKIADMSSDTPLLEIKGFASGPMDAFLRWAVASPVNVWLDGFLQNAKATGNGRLNLGLSLPLAHMDTSRVNGEFVFSGNRIELGGDIPPLDAVNGKLRFTERDVRANDVTAEALGGPLKLSISTEGGRIKTLASGTASFEKVRDRFAYPLVDQLTGQAQWQLDMSQPTRVAPGAAPDSVMHITATTLQTRWPLDAILQVTAAPRDPAVPVKLTLVRTALEKGRDRLDIELPGQLHAIMERSASNAAGLRTVERATLDVGALKTGLPARGYSVRGDVARLDADAAIALLSPMADRGQRSVGGLSGEATSSPEAVNINVRATEAILYAHKFNDVSLRAQPDGQRWRLALRSKEATGVISIETKRETGAVESVTLRLQRLSLPSAAVAVGPNAPVAVTSASNASTTPWPKLELIADSFVSDGRDLGKLEVRAQPSKDEWRIEQVKLSSADGVIDGKGRWLQRVAGASASAGGSTEMDVKLSWGDASKFMTRFGLPKGVERAPGTITGTLSWVGSPAQFGYAKLAGKFSLETAPGRFTEMEPGLAKLLGVLSLQSLPRRLSFNFDDLFGRGFAFDEIKADVTLADGSAKTDNFQISGPSARVQIRGSADINRETQDLHVRVYPSLSTATAIGIGIMTANPAIGAAALLGQKLARDPIERLLMQEFDVKGTWAKPETTPVKSAAGAAAGATASDVAQ